MLLTNALKENLPEQNVQEVEGFATTLESHFKAIGRWDEKK